MGTRCLLLRSRIQNDPGPVPDAAEALPRTRGSDSSIEVNQAGAEEDPSHASLFQVSSTKRVENMGMAMPQTKQSTPFRSGATHASSPVLMVGAKPVKPWLVLTAVLFGFFMAVLDMTIMNIAIPSIQTGLKADLLSTSWVLNAYNLMYAVLLITVGRLADQYGRKRLLLIAMILFSLGSLGCALAQAPVIDAFRTTWLFAALCAVIGFVSALLISAMHRPLTRKEIPANETENV